MIFDRGKGLGRNVGVFSLAGGVLAADPAFLDDVGMGAVQWGDYEATLSPVLAAFQTPVAEGNSFTHPSLAANATWTAADLLNPAQADPARCQPGETPLACEIRIAQPAYMLVGVGRNEADLNVFRQGLEAAIQTVADAGVVPVLVTLPGPVDRVGPYNDVIVSVAQGRSVPVWNLWLALRDLPGGGVNPDGTLTLSGPGQTAVFTAEGLQYGANRANLSALQLLKTLRDFLAPIG